MKFEVVSGYFRAVRETAEEALKCAKARVYLSTKDEYAHLLKLQHGQRTQWAYGFNEVHIFVREGHNGN